MYSKHLKDVDGRYNVFVGVYVLNAPLCMFHHRCTDKYCHEAIIARMRS